MTRDLDHIPVEAHGTPAGYQAGCRSRGGCPRHTSEHLTCVEAQTQEWGQYRPPKESTRRSILQQVRDHEPQPNQRPARQRSARTRESRTGHLDSGRRPTAESTRDVSEGRSRSPQRVRAPADRALHGTEAGYIRGCTHDDFCPRGHEGTTCREARNVARRRRARAAGTAARLESIDAHEAAERIRELQDLGMSLRAIGRASAVGHTTITNIARGVTSAIWPSTLDRIVFRLREFTPATVPTTQHRAATGQKVIRMSEVCFTDWNDE
jgi:hypothetical protein